MKSTLTHRLLTVLLMAPLILTGCQNSGADIASQNKLCSATGAMITPLSEQKTVAIASGLRVAQASELIFKSGTSFVVQLKDACGITDGRGGLFTRSTPNRLPGVTRSGVRSYEWTSDRDYSLDDIKSLADADECLTMITESRLEYLPEQDLGGIAPLWLPSDPRVSAQAHLTAIDASSAFEIFFPAENPITQTVVIAIIDSGVLLKHEDLKESLWRNSREIAGNGIDDDQNGYIDDVYGFNFASRIADPNPQRSTANGSWQWAHGTRVSGLAAATAGNGRGGTGVAPNAKIMALNAMGTAASFAQSNLANAIRYATDNGAKVINLSIGGNNGQTADLRSAIRYAIANGVMIFAAAGNEGSSIGSSYSAAGLSPLYPGLVSVGNFQAATFLKSSSSNYSTTYVKLGAPGTKTSSSLLLTTSSESTTTYSGFSGTSAATPVASGAAALAIGFLQGRGYSATPALVESLLLESARTVSALSTYFKDGNALNIGQLARLIAARYPTRSAGINEDPGPATEIACP